MRAGLNFLQLLWMNLKQFRFKKIKNTTDDMEIKLLINNAAKKINKNDN